MATFFVNSQSECPSGQLETSSLDETLLKDSTTVPIDDLDTLEDALLKTPTKAPPREINASVSETFLLEETMAETPTQDLNEMTMIDEDDEISFKVKVEFKVIRDFTGFYQA